MKFGVVIFPGSNCDQDIIYILEKKLKQEVVKLWHKDTNLQKVDFIILPGGFSYGDYLRSGALARYSPIMKEIIKFANSGGYVMGICNGFQILTETGLLPGALLRNSKLKFICKNVFIKTTNNQTAFTKKIPENKILSIPIAHNEGNYFASKDEIQSLKEHNQIVFQYCDEEGNISGESNPNGSFLNIAGISNQNKNVLGIMPHPERSIDQLLGGVDGQGIFQSLL